LESVCKSTQEFEQAVFGVEHVHVPAEQANPDPQAVWSCQAPSALHFCGTFTFEVLHWSLSGVHTPVQPPAVTEHRLAQVCVACTAQAPALHAPLGWYTRPVQVAVPHAVAG
jgi:hypothetical protein